MTVTNLPTFMAEVFSRVIAMQTAVVPGAQAGSYATFNYPYGNMYWTNRLEGIATPDITNGVDEYSFTIPIIMRLHTGFLGQDNTGAMELELMGTHVPTVLAYFLARRDLVYQAGQGRIPFLTNEIDVACTSGLSIFEDESGAKKMLGVEFRLVVSPQFKIVRTI